MASSTQTILDIYSSRTIESVSEAVKNYVHDVRSVYPVLKAVFFGSWVKGLATEHSDVDVCFFLQDCAGKSDQDALLDIDLMTLKYAGMVIEPHVFKKEGLNSDHPFIREILETGIEI